MAKKKVYKNKSAATKAASQSAKPPPTSIADSINTEVIAEALNAATTAQPVLLKLCRLCEAKDGPFLNIFDADKVIAKKIDELMPFGIEEHDDLPHKICFRCSAKVEELYEFVQKCIRTQVSLRKAVGKTGQLTTKIKTRTLWEEKLNKSNMSNDDICNALIQKAMEGIKDIPLNPLPNEYDEKHSIKKEIKNEKPKAEKETEFSKKIDIKKKEQDITPLVKEHPEKINEKVPSTRASRSSNLESSFEGVKGVKGNATKQITSETKNNDTSIKEEPERGIKRKAANSDDSTPGPAKKIEVKSSEIKDNKEPFNIMDHVSMIKVNGVGVLFQCKLCNRNFLKKEVVMSHACAKNGGPKQEAIPEYLPPNPPKIPIVKYINTKSEGLHPKPAIVNEKPIVLDEELPAAPSAPPPAPSKPKPKAGPASKTKRNDTDTQKTDPSLNINIQVSQNPDIAAPIVQFPTFPRLNSRYKLVSGPNNTFTLVEEKVTQNTEYVSSDESNLEKSKVERDPKKKKSKSKHSAIGSSSSKGPKLNENAIPDKDDEIKTQSSDLPYPVGLIKRPVEHANDYIPPTSDSIAFTTPAMKKQSYTIVQTGNPSKLLISTKPKPIVEEVPKKKAKKGKHDSIGEDASGQPFSVTLEDSAPPKESGFFTFINVDPLLQPSYVLPTASIIQESQISTSTAPSNSHVAATKEEKEKDKYTCNMCGERFSREKKLLSHIQSHYSKMDEEDQQREKIFKKRGRKS